MRLTVVGCSGSYPGPDSASSCYLVEHDGFRLVMDLGNGAIGPLQRYAELASLDAVLISHLHADHCADLAALSVARRYYLGHGVPVLPLLGPAGAPDVVTAIGSTPREAVASVFDVAELKPGTRAVGPFRLTTVRMHHPVETYGMRLEVDGRTLAYTADTGPGSALAEVAAGADLLLAEASFPETGSFPIDLHLDGRQAGEAARAGGVGRLVVTHVPPTCDRAAAAAAAKRSFDGQVDLAEPGVVFDV